MRPELLAPAGDMECLQAALRYGADAVYLSGKNFGMRSSPANFGTEELQQAVQQAHARGVRVYVTCNIIPHSHELEPLSAFIKEAAVAGVDAFIIADVGVLRLAKKYAPQVDVHISTQAGVANYAAARMFYELGASRVVLARELALEEISQLRAKTPPALEIEAFVHGAMCMSFSGRCLLSNYMVGRDANHGDCAQPCRWRYALMEEKRPGQYFPILEDERGSYILNSRDLCMVGHIPELLQAGVTSLKIEGRAKAAYYTAVVTNAYRAALDAALCGEALPCWVEDEVEKVSHRAYHTGFYMGDEPGQETETGGYIRDWEVAAVCVGHCADSAVLLQRNRFFKGETLEVLEPGRPPFSLVAEHMTDIDGNPLESVCHAAMTVLLHTDAELKEGAYLRRRRV